jgi:galactokinase
MRETPKKEKRKEDSWFEYIEGCAAILRLEGENLSQKGFDAVLLGDVPQKIGLASSVALAVCALLVFDEQSRLKLPKMKIAKLAQRVETDWIGTRCGIADSITCTLGQAGKALLIDCLSGEHSFFGLLEGMSLVIWDTNTYHEPPFSAYLERRRQREAACELFGVSSMRDVTLEMLDKYQKEMSEVLFRRVCHVLTEDMRTRAASTALDYQENHLFGTMMNESHTSLDSEFDASCPELDAICAVSRSYPACLGARMTNGVSGDNAIALVHAAATREFVSYVSEGYREKTGRDVRAYVCTASDGGNIEKL